MTRSDLLIAIIPASVAAIGSWLTSWYAASKVKEVHVLINSRMSELLEITRTSSFSAGRKAETDKQEAFAAGERAEKYK